ncbi:MAG: proprotein convertase P-domain-containing protein, partial [Bacteroidota bacterium]
MVKATFTLKNCWQWACALVLTAALPFMVSAQTFSGMGLPLPVPASGSGTSDCSTATETDAMVSASGFIGSTATLDQVELTITHTFDGDLEITLVSPAGTALDLTSDNGGSGDDFINTVFIDGGTPIDGLGAGDAPFTGMFEPEGGTFASTFAGEQINGVWTLVVCDDAGGDTGTLEMFDISFTVDDTPVMGTSCGDGSGNSPIPDNGFNGSLASMASLAATTAVDVPAGATVTDITATVTMEHTFVGDLTFILEAPDGTVLPLMNRPGVPPGTFGNGDDIAINVPVNFNDGFAVDAEDMGDSSTSFVGDDGVVDFFPNGDGLAAPGDAGGPLVTTFAALFPQNDGLDGIWTLYVGDSAGADTGFIAGIEVCVDYEGGASTEMVGIEISDPCSCNDDATPIDLLAGTGGDDGTFGETIAMIDENGGDLGAGRDFQFTLLQDGDGVDIAPAGTPLVYNAADGTYDFSFNHVDRVGYTARVQEYDVTGAPIGPEFEIGNICAYPDPFFDPALDEIYCAFQDAITLGANDVDAVGADGVTFTIDGNAATVFDPVALGPGTYEVALSYDGASNGNVSADGVTPAFPGCVQDAFTTVVVEDLNVGCIGNINVTLGEDCGATIVPGMVLTGNFACADDFNITVDGTNDNKIVGCGDHTYMIEVIVEDEVVYTCWGDIFAEDKTDPILECPDDTDVVINADFDIQTAMGTIDATDPTIELADYSCFLSLFDPVAGPYGYDLLEISVSATDVYNIIVDGDVADQTFISVFAGDFNPDNPC